METQKILVIGSSGTVGRSLVKILRREGHAVREATSRPELVRAGLEERVLVDLSTGEGVLAAFKGVDRAFLLSPPGHADQHATLSPLIKAAKTSGLKKVVLMTAMEANAVESAPFRRAELELERSGLAWNIIRPNWFLQNFVTFWGQGIKSHGVVELPAGTAKTSFVDTDDVARVAAILLTSSHHDGRDFDLTGPEGLTHDKVARAIGEALGKLVTYQDIAPETLHGRLVSAGLPRDYVDFMIMIFGFLRDGYNARTTENVEMITGRKPTGLASWVAKHVDQWK